MVVLELEAIVLATGVRLLGRLLCRTRVPIYVHLCTDPASQVPCGQLMFAGFVERATNRAAVSCLPVVAAEKRARKSMGIDRARLLETASRTKRDEAQSLLGEDLVKQRQKKA